jgi:hypothetical protein
LADIPLPPSVVLTPAVAAVVSPSTRWSSAALHMKPHDALNHSMKMSVPTMGPNTDFKQWKRNFLNFFFLKATYLIPQLALRESGAWLNEQAQHYADTLLLHAASANQRSDQAMKCVSHARPDCAIAA